MFDNLQALVALSETGTMSSAATRLRVSQSAVSKRIKSLEDSLGKDLVERDGRYVRFTQEGLRLLQRSRPLLTELREVLADEVTESKGTVVVAVSESILYSWGAKALARAKQALPQMELVIHSHRCRVALDRVRAGEYMLAVTPGQSEHAPDLHPEHIGEEPMVIIPKSLKPFRICKNQAIPLLSCELTDSTWASITQRVKRYEKRTGIKLKVEQTIQTFSAVAKLAEAGFGHGIVPMGVANTFGFSEKEILKFPYGGISRPISIVGRRSTIAKPIVQNFCEVVASYLDELS